MFIVFALVLTLLPKGLFLLNKLKPFPIWFTESDYPANPGDQVRADKVYGTQTPCQYKDSNGNPLSNADCGEFVQALYVKDLFSLLVEDHSDWVIFWASLIDDKPDDPPFTSTGLVHNVNTFDVGNSKPSYIAMKNLYLPASQP